MLMNDLLGRVNIAGFCRRFIKDFSKISKPLTNILQKDIPFVFYDDCVEAFEILKRDLITGDQQV